MTTKNLLIVVALLALGVAAYYWYTRAQTANAALGMGPVGTAATGTIATVPLPMSAATAAPFTDNPQGAVARTIQDSAQRLAQSSPSLSLYT